MSRKRKEKVRELKSKHSNFQNKSGGEKKKKMNTNARRCPHCGHEMRARGCGDAAGGVSWKCRNKKCGRTVWERRNVTPPVPLVPTSLMSRFY